MELEWVRGEEIGRGSFATISKAKLQKPSPKLPPIIAVKSSESLSSSSLKNEKSVLERIGNCAQIIRCFGDQTSSENNKSLYNLLLEYASNGSLADQVRLRGGKLAEPEIRRHARSILRGLSFIHSKGFVHCDIKLQNILVFGDGASKIADFGLAKEERAKIENRCQLRGTPLYMSPESVNDNVYESPCDIWAFGCAVAEMATGRPIWAHKPGSSVWPLLIRIGGPEQPNISAEISDEARDFLNKCFIKDPSKRWTAEMLLNHAFVADVDDYDCDGVVGFCGVPESSPRCPFEFPEWVSDSELSTTEFSSSVMGRVHKLVTRCGVSHDWSFSETWVTIRD